MEVLHCLEGGILYNGGSILNTWGPRQSFIDLSMFAPIDVKIQAKKEKRFECQTHLLNDNLISRYGTIKLQSLRNHTYANATGVSSMRRAQVHRRPGVSRPSPSVGAPESPGPLQHLEPTHREPHGEEQHQTQGKRKRKRGRREVGVLTSPSQQDRRWNRGMHVSLSKLRGWCRRHIH